VKCLQSIAEEKAANFDTLRKDIHPATDFLAVFLWEWHRDATAVKWDRAPLIQTAYIFHAASLVELRDRYWLNNPPNNLGTGLQGFDLRYGVNCSEGRYSKEEGNYGKLMRLWQEGTAYQGNPSELMKRTIADYLRFKTEAIDAGLDALANRYLPALSEDPSLTRIVHEGVNVGWKTASVAFVHRSYLRTRAQKQSLLPLISTPRVFTFSDRYDWRECELTDGDLKEIGRGNKPKLLGLRQT
jgi:hypothetical protein